MDTQTIQRVVSKAFRGYDKEFVNELARLLILDGAKFKIDNKNRLSIFLANVKAEVGINRITRKVKMREYMGYSAKRLKKVFKIFRNNPELAQKYGRTLKHKANTRMIANIAYSNRLGNGGIASGDGYRYRGVGILQTTGREDTLKGLKVVENKTGIRLTDSSGDAFDGVLDTYTIGILLGMAYFYRSGMYKCENMKCAVDIINRYTDSRKKRYVLYNKISKYV